MDIEDLKNILVMAEQGIGPGHVLLAHVTILRRNEVRTYIGNPWILPGADILCVSPLQRQPGGVITTYVCPEDVLCIQTFQAESLSK